MEQREVPDTDTRLHAVTGEKPYKSRTRNPEATREQQTVMELAQFWFHNELRGPRGGAARQWLARYGITSEDCTQYPWIGYAPSMQDTRVKEMFFSYMEAPFRDEQKWQDSAYQVGLLTTDEIDGTPTLRFQNRLIFTSYAFPPLAGSAVMYLQARRIDREDLPIYLTTTGIKPYPFWLPTNRVRFPGTCLVKSVKDVLVLSRHMVRSVVLRPSLDLTLLKEFPGPFFQLLPHDDTFQNGREETYSTELKQQLTLMRYCNELEKEYYPIVMPMGYTKATDWFVQEGVNALFEKMATLLSN